MYGPTSEYPPPNSVMETDSVKSGLSEQSWRSANHRNHSTSSHRNHRTQSHKNSRSSRSKNPEEGMAPFQTTVTMEESRPGHELIEVQILPQDDNWGENTTGLTGNTSEQSGSVEEVGLWSAEPQPGLATSCYRYLGLSLAVLLSTLAFLSPLFMLILPKIGFFPSLGASLSAAQKAELLSCGAECKGLVVSLCFKLVILAGGVWALFLRRSRATLPSIFMFRAVVLLLIFICCFTYWLFYVVQITEGARESATGEETLEYKSVVSYASTLTDTLLFIHYLAVILIEIRHLQPMFYVKIVRSPDGESRSYAMGEMSVQRAAIWILDRYYTEFPIYNPYLERLPVSKSRKPASSFKYYHVDNMSNTPTQGQSRGSLRESRRRDSSHNERFYEEHDYERRVKKRRARLITATEEAFTHIKRLHHDPSHYPEGTGGGGGAMDCREAAQAVFPSLARALQKYLRVTRQQPRHSVDSILRHLSLSLAHDLSPRAFLHPFLTPAPVLQDWKEGQKETQGWSLICEELLTRPVSPGLVFQLRQSDVSLLVTVQSLPHFNITEEVIHPLTNRFVIRLNSETSV